MHTACVLIQENKILDNDVAQDIIISCNLNERAIVLHTKISKFKIVLDLTNKKWYRSIK